MVELLSRWILTVVIFAPLAGALMICLMNPRSHEQIRRAALYASLATLGFTLAALRLFQQAEHTSGQVAWKIGQYALSVRVPWLGGSDLLPSLDLAYHIGIDGVSIWLVALTALLTPLAIWSSFTAIRERVKEFYVLILLVETGMLGVFCARDLLLFYAFFEFTMAPMYFIVGIWGGPEKRRAAIKFFIYTIAGDALTLAAVLFLAYQAYRTPGIGVFTFDLDKLYAVGKSLDTSVQVWLFLALSAGFAVKVPMFPLHTWLPLAHTEAPTAGSVILAGLLLKLGTYGFLRMSVPMLPTATLELAAIVATLGVVGIVYGALAAWVQTDVKRLVAYSSVSHLGFVMLGLFSLKMAGLTGSLLYMVNHGLSTGALFLVLGMMYERYHTRSIQEIGGLARRMPWLAFFLVFFTLSSLGLPGLNGFVGEFLVLVGTFSSAATLDGNPAGPLSPAYAVLAATGVVLSAVYLLWMCQRVLFGPLREPAGTPDVSHGLKPDLTRREIAILVPIAAACLLIGVWPRPFIASMQPALQEQIVARVMPGAGMQPPTAQDARLDAPPRVFAATWGARLRHAEPGEASRVRLAPARSSEARPGPPSQPDTNTTTPVMPLTRQQTGFGWTPSP
jgi:NADH-quinone oxidoreductase subunit M